MSESPFVPATRLTAPTPAPSLTTTAQLARPGAYGRGRFVVRSAEVQTSAMGPYLRLSLGDRFGEVLAISWRGAPLAAQLPSGKVVEIVKFNVDDKGPKFEPADLRLLSPGDFQPQDFVASLPAADIDRNWREFHSFLDSVRSPHLQSLRARIWGDAATAAAYKTHPSGVFHHHNYLGGNVQHVVGIMRIVEAVCAGYPAVDRDLVVFGAAIHDLGKLREYAVDTTIRVTEEGRLRGHLVIGAEWIGRLCAELRATGEPFPAGLEGDLVHMILSHHGKGEWGSPKPPATPEAMLLHLADYADSQTKKFLQDVDANASNPDGWFRRFDPDIGESRWIRTRRDPSP